MSRECWFDRSVPRAFTRNRRLPRAYHVYNQGFRSDGQRPRRIFLDDEDRRYFLALLARHLGLQPRRDARGRFFQHLRSWIVLLAYCVMTTHFHLIVWQRDPRGIAELANRITSAYTRYFNTKHGNTAPLFNGPVRSKPITSREYFKWVVGYVHDNHPDGVDYEFSSHRAWIDDDLRPDWLDPEPGLAIFGGVDDYLEHLDARELRRQLDRKFGFGQKS